MPADAENLTFWSHVLTTLIGTLAGFIFSIALFYFSESTKRSNRKKQIRKSLRREFLYNISQLETWASLLDSTLTLVAAGDRQVFSYFPYTRYSRFFVQESFRDGILFDLLDNEETRQVEALMAFFWTGGEELLNAKIREWSDGTIEAKALIPVLRFNRDKITEHQATLRRLAQKCAPDGGFLKKKSSTT